MKKSVGSRDILRTLAALLLFMLAFLSSCNKSPISPSPTRTTTRDTTLTDSSFYIDVTLNGVREFRILHVDSSWNRAWFSGDFPPDTTVAIYQLNRIGSVFDSVANSYPGLGFSLGDINYLQFGYPQSYSLMNILALDSFLRAGNYPFSQLSKDTSYTVVYDSNGDTLTAYGNPVSGKILTTGVQLSWYDSHGKAWKTYLGSGDQSNSYFTIVKTEHDPSNTVPGFANYDIISAEFTCNLYDGLGNLIHLTNGRFRLWATV